MKNKTDVNNDDKLYGISAGSLLGVGAALSCKGLFNLVAADPTLTLVACVAVGLIVGIGASIFMTRLSAKLRTDQQENKTEVLGSDFPHIKP